MICLSHCRAGVCLSLAPGEVGILQGLDWADGEPCSKKEERRGERTGKGGAAGSGGKTDLGSAMIASGLISTSGLVMVPERCPCSRGTWM